MTEVVNCQDSGFYVLLEDPDANVIIAQHCCRWFFFVSHDHAILLINPIGVVGLVIIHVNGISPTVTYLWMDFHQIIKASSIDCRQITTKVVERGENSLNLAVICLSI